MRRIIILIAVALASSGCQPQSPGVGASNVEETPATRGRVMIIGLDGARSDGLQIADTPNIDALINLGQATFHAITGDVSLSGPGWASMLTGVWCDKHNVLDNDATWQQSQFDQYPHFIQRVEAVAPELNTVSISHWAPINDEILCADERDDNCGGADQINNVGTDAEVRDAVVEALTNGNPDVVFMQFDDIDHAGHGDPPYAPPLGDIGGFCPFADGDRDEDGGRGACMAANFNQNYLDTIETTDGYIGDILNALLSRPDFVNENWLIISSPDHGGGGVVINQHGFPHEQDRRTFFILAGNAVTGWDNALNIKIVDVAATALQHLGIALDPAWNLDGQAVGLANATAYVERDIPACADQLGVFGDDRTQP